MGQTTPFMGIYIPSAGETNYDQSFAAGMLNIDQHDHSGGPNKGVPITTAGLSPFSVTYDKLNANVVDPTTGIGVSGALPNQLQILGLLKNIYQLAATSGFITKDGVLAHARTFQDSATVTWTNPDGVSGDPVANVDISGLTPVSVANGGTGKTSFNAWDIILGGTTSTGPLQQVSGEGTLGQVLYSAGPAAIPAWGDAIVYQASTNVTAAQINALNVTPITLVPAQGAGKVIMPLNCLAKLNYVADFTGGSSQLILSYNGIPLIAPMAFVAGTFIPAGASRYAWATTNNGIGSTGVALAGMENIPLQLCANVAPGGGAGSTITFMVTYLVISI